MVALAPPTRQRLLDAAASLFLEHGFAATSMEAVRHSAGVSNGSLYHHFPTKGRLADALYAHLLRDFHAAMVAPLTSDVSAEEGVQAFVRAYIRWVERRPSDARLLHDLRSSGAVGSASGEWSEVNARGFATLGSWIEARVAAGEMQALPISLWTALVLGPSMSLTPRWVRRAESRVTEAEATALARAAWLAVAARAGVRAPKPAARHRRRR